MKCSTCGKETEPGYLFATKDGAFSFAGEVPGVFKNAKSVPGFVGITALSFGHRIRIKAHICKDCRSLILNY